MSKGIGLTLYTPSFKGIGQITARELRYRYGSDIRRIRTHKVRDYDITRFDTHLPVTGFLALGTVEDLFCELALHPLTGDKKDLGDLQAAVQAAPFEPALNLHRQTVSRSRRKRPTYRVIVQAESASWRHYRRLDMQTAAEQALGSCYPRWKGVPDDADLEFWIQQIGKQALVGLRLTDRTMRHRTYKTANLPASLRPTIARALVQLTHPEEDDTFLDPLCGAGTVLIERALAGRYRLLVGGDIDENAVETTLTNFGNRHKPREINHWDAKHLPLPDASIHKVATNLPWGRQIGTPAEIGALYNQTLQEIDRVLKPDSIAVFLTSQWNAFKSALEKTPALTLAEQIQDIRVLGRRADIFVIRKW